MDEKAPKATIRNVTRTSLNIQLPGESIRLRPGEAVEVHEAYLETAELKTLRQQGAVAEIEPRPPAKAATDEGETESGSEPARRESGSEPARRTSPRKH
ncbi:MAG TPA: hypothetical protein VKI41_13545 [Vicinamibacteria bacterium]|nr:hypothetical protein [Vicinamibacteria bacterium]